MVQARDAEDANRDVERAGVSTLESERPGQWCHRKNARFQPIERTGLEPFDSSTRARRQEDTAIAS